MRFPSREEISCKSHEHLWTHDRNELHGDPRTATSASYRIRLKTIVELVEQYSPSPSTVLDAACAQGNIAISLSELGYEVLGLDLRPKYLTYARMKDEEERVDWLCGSVEALPLSPESVDVLILGEILEHVAYPETMLREGMQVVRPGGIGIVTTPNGSFVRSGRAKLSDISDRSEIARHQFKPDADGHLYLPTREELIILGTGAGGVFEQHCYFQTPPITGWPRMQRFVERIPKGMRHYLEAWMAKSSLARAFSFGQAAVFRKPGRDV